MQKKNHHRKVIESFNSLNEFLTNRSIILCLGNELRGDDSFGVKLAERISGKLKDIRVIKAGTVPENYVGSILKESVEKVLIVDVAEIGTKPGEFKIVNPDKIRNLNISTHDSSVKMAIDYLFYNGIKEIKCLLIQACSSNIGEEMTPRLKKTLNTLTDYLVKKFA